MATPGSDTPIIHLIDDDGALVATETLDQFLAASLGRSASRPTSQTSAVDVAAALKAVGLRYRVVGVFGGQSSGKSTLLNHLFETHFVTMNENERQQTTRGSFLSKSKHGDNLFVMDFEGTDGVERGEDQSFERQLSLFALSVAGTLIVNMWAAEVGRFNAANLSLLRTVFEVNLQLFSHFYVPIAVSPTNQGTSPVIDPQTTSLPLADERPTLLFVLRDHTSGSLATHREVMLKSLNQLWKSISKPQSLKHAKIEDIFDLKFFSLPHYVLQKEAFVEEVRRLQRRFVSREDPDYLYLGQEQNFRRVPLEGLSKYLESCWTSIKNSKDLDIPSQREMLAKYRCSQLSEEIAKGIQDLAEQKLVLIKKQMFVPKLSTELQTAVDEYLKYFAEQTQLYSPEVVEVHRQQLIVSLKAQIDDVVRQQAKGLAEIILRKMHNGVQEVVDVAVSRLLRNLSSVLLLHHDTKTETEVEERAHQTTMESLDAECRTRVMSFWKGLHAGLEKLAEELRLKPQLAFSGVGGLPVESLASCIEAFESDPLTVEWTVEQVALGLRSKLRQRVEAMASDAATTLTKAFDGALNRGDDGTVRTFATAKGLHAAFPAARWAGLLVLSSIFCVRNPNHSTSCEAADFFLSIGDGTTKPAYPRATPTDAVEAVLLDEPAVQRAFELYDQQCNFTYQLQMRAIESGQANIPAWLYGLLLILGANEMYYVATSPLLLLFLVFIVVVFFKAWVVRQWQTFKETGPPAIVLPLDALLARVSTALPPQVSTYFTSPARAEHTQVPPSETVVHKQQQSSKNSGAPFLYPDRQDRSLYTLETETE